MIHVGDKVELVRRGEGFEYPNSQSTINFYSSFVGHDYHRICENYEIGHFATDDEVQTKIFTVAFIRYNLAAQNMRVVIFNRENTFVVSPEALEVVSSTIKFEVGTEVTISDGERCYSSWESLIDSLAGQISAEEREQWRNGLSPNNGDFFKVIWAGAHICRPDETNIYVISDGQQTYVMGEEGLTSADPKAKYIPSKWALYIHYVREWSWEHKNSTADPYMGPLNFTAWLSEYNLRNNH